MAPSLLHKRFGIGSQPSALKLPTSNREAPLGTSPCDALPSSARENSYCESLYARFRNELLNGELFYSLREAQILIEQWRIHYNTVRPHSALGYRPPAPETIVPMEARPVMY